MKFKNVKFVFLGFVIFIVIFAVFHMTSKNKKKQNNETNIAEQIVYQDNIKLGVSNLDSTNPLITKNKQLLDIYQLVFEPLFSIDYNYSLKNCLATEYAKTSATTYIVKIDNSIKWSNGSNVNADDVKFTVDLLKSRDNIYSENVKAISNVEAIDNNTVKFNLDEDVPFFEYNLIFPIMCQNQFNGKDFFKGDQYPIGTGLYKISTISSNQIVLEKNNNYRNHEKENKNINKIYINIFSEVGEVYNSFKIGNVDIINTSSTTYENYIGTIGYYIKEYKGREYDFLSCNCNDYLMQEKSVRQAINLAIDKENIVSTVFNNKCYESDFVLDYGNYLYKKNTVSSGYNPEKAKEVLRNDGWIYSNNRWRKNGKNLSISLAVNSSNTQRCEVAKNIKAQLENIGIPVNILEISDSQYNSYLENKNYQILLTGVYNSYNPELTYFYGENNISNYNNDDIKAILNDVKNITDKKELEKKYDEITNIVKEDCPYISLYRNKNSLLINQNLVGNFEPNNYGIFSNFESWNKE